MDLLTLYDVQEPPTNINYSTSFDNEEGIVYVDISTYKYNALSNTF